MMYPSQLPPVAQSARSSIVPPNINRPDVVSSSLTSTSQLSLDSIKSYPIAQQQTSSNPNFQAAPIISNNFSNISPEDKYIKAKHNLLLKYPKLLHNTHFMDLICKDPHLALVFSENESLLDQFMQPNEQCMDMATGRIKGQSSAVEQVDDSSVKKRLEKEKEKRELEQEKMDNIAKMQARLEQELGKISEMKKERIKQEELAQRELKDKEQMLEQMTEIFGQQIPPLVIKQGLELCAWEINTAIERFSSLIPTLHKISFEGRQVLAFNKIRAIDLNFNTNYKTIKISIAKKEMQKQQSPNPYLKGLIQKKGAGTGQLFIKLKEGIQEKNLTQMEHFVWRYGDRVDSKVSALKKVPWWSYGVKKSDKNYEQRQDKSVDFFEFDSDQNFQIEMFYQECLQGLNNKFGDRYRIAGDQNLVQTGNIYEIWGMSQDPTTWFEQNMSFKNAPQRRLRRVLKDVQDQGDSQFGVRAFVISSIEEEKGDSENIFDLINIENDDEEEVKEGEIDHIRSIVTVEGSEEEILKLKQKVNEYSQNPRNFISFVDFEGTAAPDFLEALKKEAIKRYQINDLVVAAGQLKIIGFNCEQARRFSKKALMLRAKYTQRLIYPKHWQNVENIENDPILLRPVTQKQELNQVQNEFLKSMPGIIVVKIERIQNAKLWQKFHMESSMIEKKLQSKEAVNIRYLFHGTSQTPPSAIYQSEQGFNLCYANDGMWGRANYFAAKAFYSITYSHVLPDGNFQMFYARVILGKCKALAPDKTLREPPFIDGSTTVRYDSVQGFTRDTDVFMVYSNAKAYPEYLITYKLDQPPIPK
ncbi:hypothetical protein FGO68_gene12245 [Halteria grandinella]|uniref:Poly [ADP-ribose] polymerase n=1 Tax=Halteria grandinella TaxID=5974 RepID=A0A8J8P2K1_HALGN|nr:hypothetical protein FGO68_gene12245 [Halteria grandinella]